MDEKNQCYNSIDNLNNFQSSSRHNISAPSAAREDKLHSFLHTSLGMFLLWATKF